MSVASQPEVAEPEPGVPPPKRSKKPWIIGGAVVLLAVVAFLAFGVFGLHTLFIDKKVTEAAPTFRSGAKAPAAAPGPSTPTPAASGVKVTATGTFVTREHDGKGTVDLLTDGSQTFVRFEEDFATDNGPDLYAVVYAGDKRIELGGLKGNQGSQNYELPADVDATSLTSVAVWCKRFDATFTEATLNA